MFAGATGLQDEVDLVDVGAEQQERRQRRRGDGISLRQRLRRVADRVQSVGDLAGTRLGPAELGDAAGVVRDRAEGVHCQDVGGGHEHAHGRDGGPEDAADVVAVGALQARLVAEPMAGEEGVVSKPTAVPLMMFVAGPVRDASAISRTGRYEPAV